MSGIELRNCPFCGGEAMRHNLPSDEYGNDGGAVIECSGCLASSHVEFGFKENLVSAWNRRTPDPAQIRADALREAADHLRGLGYNTAVRTILALIATPLSPTAVDGSPAPDAGSKGEIQ